MPRVRSFDGVLLEEWHLEGDQLVRRTKQPTEDLILNNLAELRKNEGAIKTLEWGALGLVIPTRALIALWKKYPDLQSPHRETRRNAWKKFIESSEADEYRIKDRNKRRGPHTLQTTGFNPRIAS